MHLNLRLHACAVGQVLPLIPGEAPYPFVLPAHRSMDRPPHALPLLPVGTSRTTPTAPALLKVTGRVWLPALPGQADPHALCCSLLTALTDLAGCPDLGGPLAAPAGPRVWKSAKTAAAWPGSRSRTRVRRGCARI